MFNLNLNVEMFFFMILSGISFFLDFQFESKCPLTIRSMVLGFGLAKRRSKAFFYMQPACLWNIFFMFYHPAEGSHRITMFSMAQVHLCQRNCLVGSRQNIRPKWFVLELSRISLRIKVLSRCPLCQKLLCCLAANALYPFFLLFFCGNTLIAFILIWAIVPSSWRNWSMLSEVKVLWHCTALFWNLWSSISC